MALSLTLACTDYEWLEPLVRGEVTPDGVDLTVLTGMGGGERHRRTRFGEFDVAEFSLGTYLTGWPDWEFTAIPAFPRRFFPHSRVFVHRDAGIDRPRDLEGKRVCLTSYQNTLAVWMKGVFAEHYDLDLERVEWLTWKPEPVAVDLPVELTVLDRDRPRATLLARGEVDAIAIPSTGSVYPLADPVERLFDDLQAEEGAYFEGTGHYPVMHNVVIRNELVDEYPWLPTELVKAFRRSAIAFTRRANFEAKYPLVWWQSYREQEQAVFGDIWNRSFEFEANADELETLVRYAREQGLMSEPADPETLFLPVDDRLL